MRISDCSSDVCSSDLQRVVERTVVDLVAVHRRADADVVQVGAVDHVLGAEGRVAAGQLRHHVARFKRLDPAARDQRDRARRSEEHTSELQSLMRIAYAVCCMKTTTRYT